MPVQSPTTLATAWKSTVGSISGLSPCRVASSACTPRSSVMTSARSPSLRVLASGAVSALASNALPVPSMGCSEPRSFARSDSRRSTSAFSPSQRFFRPTSRSFSAASNALTDSSRSAVGMPMAASRAMMPISVSSASMRRCESSTSAGTACRLMATRADAVSSRLTDLSGSWRAGM